IVGIHSRDNDLVVNPIRTKQLTNIRASGKDEAILLTPPIDLTLEYAVEFIGDGELVEITPKSIRLRKRHLREHERRRAEREPAWPCRATRSSSGAPRPASGCRACGVETWCSSTKGGGGTRTSASISAAGSSCMRRPPAGTCAPSRSTPRTGRSTCPKRAGSDSDQLSRCKQAALQRPRHGSRFALRIGRLAGEIERVAERCLQRL